MIDALVQEQLKATTEGPLSIVVTNEDTNEINASTSNSVLKALVETGKSLKLSFKKSTITIPASVLADILENTSSDSLLVISIKLDETLNTVDLTITTIEGEKVTQISIFNEKITVSLPLPSDVKDSDKVAVYYVDEETGTLHYVQSKVVGNEIIFKTSHFSKFKVAENNLTFKDLVKYDWARQFIESLASKSIIKGKADDTFAPGDRVTREEFTVLLARALDIPKAAYEGVFNDVTEVNAWSVLEVEAANRAGIVVGNGEKFDPKAFITREEMVTMIIRALKYDSPNALKDVNSTISFSDTTAISHFAKESVGFAVSKGIVNGIEGTDGLHFAPSAFATRAEAAKMLYLLLENLD